MYIQFIFTLSKILVYEYNFIPTSYFFGGGEGRIPNHFLYKWFYYILYINYNTIMIVIIIGKWRTWKLFQEWRQNGLSENVISIIEIEHEYNAHVSGSLQFLQLIFKGKQKRLICV